VTDAKPSKSARKREHLALQELGEKLILLSDEKLASIGTDEYLVEQVRQARNISSHGALRRQKQLIGKIMRDVDPEPIKLALARFGQGDALARSVFKQAEEWRDRIATKPTEALSDFAAATGEESELLASLVSEHGNAADSERRRHIRRKMFREIHRILAR
jgi:ribosome-associated protein